MILLDTILVSLASLARLSNRIPQLENLRISLKSNASAPVEEGTKLSGNDDEDRGTLLVLFPKLVMLNGNEIRTKEREEAERRFCSLHTTLEEPILQALLETLSKKHGLQSSQPVVPEKTSLRSKMISELSPRPLELMKALHIYPSTSDAFTLSVLPSAPITMMRRKIAKKLKTDIDRLMLWTVERVQKKNTDEGQEVWDRAKVMEVGDGEIGFWFDDGDGVIVEVD